VVFGKICIAFGRFRLFLLGNDDEQFFCSLCSSARHVIRQKQGKIFIFPKTYPTIEQKRSNPLRQAVLLDFYKKFCYNINIENEKKIIFQNFYKFKVKEKKYETK